MLKYLLDTSIAIYVIKRRPPSALVAFNRHAGELAISAITLAELVHGAEKSADPARNHAVIEDFCRRLSVLDYGERAAHHCGNIRAALEAVDVNFSHVVKLNLFVLDVSNLMTLRRVRDEFVNLENPPASTLVQAAALFRPEFLFEADAIAVAPE